MLALENAAKMTFSLKIDVANFNSDFGEGHGKLHFLTKSNGEVFEEKLTVWLKWSVFPTSKYVFIAVVVF